MAPTVPIDLVHDLILIALNAQARDESQSADPLREPPTEFKIFPYGRISTSKGDFQFTPEACDAVIAERERQSAEVQIDYDHLAIEAAKPGDGKAAGWCNLQKRADGLWAVNVRWTPPAAEMLRNGEYRYFSPAFAATKKTRLIVELLNIAITNLPAMRDIEPLVAASRRRVAPRQPADLIRENGRNTQQTEITTMAKGKFGGYLAKHLKDSGTSLKAMAEKCSMTEERMRSLADGEDPTSEEMKSLAKGFGMKDDGELAGKLSAFDGAGMDPEAEQTPSSPDEVAELRTTAASRRPTGGQRSSRPANDAATDTLVELTGEVDIVKAKDVLKDVIAVARRAPAMERELEVLRSERDIERRENLIARGKREGKLTPALIRVYAKRPLAELEEFLAAAPVLPTETQHLRENEPSASAALLTAEEIEVCRLTNTPVEKMAAHVQDVKSGKAAQLIFDSYRVNLD